MKAFRQIDLSEEKKYIWSFATMLGLICIIFVLQPLQAYSNDAGNLSSNNQILSEESQFANLPIANFTQSNTIDSAIFSVNQWNSTNDGLSFKTNSNKREDIHASLIPILFSHHWRNKFIWVWNPSDSTCRPIPRLSD